MMNKVIGILGTALGTAVVAVIGMDIHEHRKIARKVDKSVSELEKATEKDIQEGMVRSAVNEAAEKKVADQMNRIRNDIFQEARAKLSEEARKAVREAGDEIRKEVSDRIASEAAMIDMTALKKSAREKAEAKILEKFDGNLEDLLQKFNDNLSNIQKIYGGIADAIAKTKEQSNGIKFTIGQ